MTIDNKTMLRLEQLSALTLTETDRTEIAGQMNAVLSRLEVLRNCPDAPPRCEDSPIILRADTVHPSTDRAALLANAPETDGEFFLVPRTVE